MSNLHIVEDISALTALTVGPGNDAQTDDVALFFYNTGTPIGLNAYILKNQSGGVSDGWASLLPDVNPGNYFWIHIPTGFPEGMYSVLSWNGAYPSPSFTDVDGNPFPETLSNNEDLIYRPIT